MKKNKLQIPTVFIGLFLSLNLFGSEFQNEISPFSTDGCSSFPDGTINSKKKWQHCCINHDIKYWAGGTAVERKQADHDLKQCVAEAQDDVLGVLMYLGVRIGGTPNSTATFRWGYGWKYNRGYKSLTTLELEQVGLMLPEFILPNEIVISKGHKPTPYPTATGNYCIDEVLAALRKIQPGANLTLVTSIDQRGIMKFKTNICDGIFTAKFMIPNTKVCTSPRYKDSESEYLSFITATKRCL